MIQLTSANGEVSYGVNEYIIDTDIELADIPKSAEAGSTAYSVSSGSTFIKGNDGNWSIKNAGAGGGGQGDSPVVELPDNLLYSYEMTEEEFWDDYSNGTLNDGLYEYIGNPEIMMATTATDMTLTALCEPVVYGDSFWAVSYELDDIILEFDKQGNIKRQISISETLKKVNDNYYNPFKFDYDTGNFKTTSDVLTIDNNGFLYINNKEGYLFTMDTSNILNCQLTYSHDGHNGRTLLFRQCSYAPTTFHIADGGCFGIQIGSHWHSNYVYYFKNGEEQRINIDEMSHESSTILYSTWATVNYDTNQLFQIRYQDDKYYIYTFNIDGTYTRQLLELPYFYSQLNNVVLLAKNNCVYIQFNLSDNNSILYTYLLDTMTNNIIQQEVFSNFSQFSTHEQERIYHSTNYDIICNKGNLEEYNIETESYYVKNIILFLKLHYNEVTPFIEPYYLEDADYDTNINFSDWCQNDKFIFSNNQQNVLMLLNLNDWTTSAPNGQIAYLQTWGNNKPLKLDNENSIILISYSQPVNTNILSIDTVTGNVISQSFNITSYFEHITNLMNHNTTTIEYMPELNAIIWADIVFNKETLTPQYYIKNPTLININKQLVMIEDQKLYFSKYDNTKFCYYKMDDENTKTSALIHKNNILLTKTIS